MLLQYAGTQPSELHVRACAAICVRGLTSAQCGGNAPQRIAGKSYYIVAYCMPWQGGKRARNQMRMGMRRRRMQAGPHTGSPSVGSHNKLIT